MGGGGGENKREKRSPSCFQGLIDSAAWVYQISQQVLNFKLNSSMRQERGLGQIQISPSYIYFRSAVLVQHQI